MTEIETQQRIGAGNNSPDQVYKILNQDKTKVIKYLGTIKSKDTDKKTYRWRFLAGKYNNTHSTSAPQKMRSEFVTLTNSTDTEWTVYFSDPEPEMFNCINAHYISNFISQVNRDYEIKTKKSDDSDFTQDLIYKINCDTGAKYLYVYFGLVLSSLFFIV